MSASTKRAEAGQADIFTPGDSAQRFSAQKRCCIELRGQGVKKRTWRKWRGCYCAVAVPLKGPCAIVALHSNKRKTMCFLNVFVGDKRVCPMMLSCLVLFQTFYRYSSNFAPPIDNTLSYWTMYTSIETSLSTHSIVRLEFRKTFDEIWWQNQGKPLQASV